MTDLRTDALIIGGGLVGQTLALALAAQEFDVTILERADAAANLAPGVDGRVSAIASAPARMLRLLGLGNALDREGCPIREIRVTDGLDHRLLSFHSAEAKPAEPLGTMMENRQLRIALLDRVRAEPRIRLLAPAELRHLDRGPAQVRAELADGRVILAPVAVAADGRNSMLRDQAGIRVARWRYDARAIVSIFTHELPHDHIASEIFYPEGPFAQLPMNDLPDGRHRSAMVWTVKPETAPGVLALSPRAIAHEARKRLGDCVGNIELIAPVSSFPLGLHHAERYWAQRLLLIGDAAHVIHPVAGQGLNMGLRDVAALAQVLAESARIGLDIGSPEVARRYERWRRADNSATAMATDGLTRLFAIPGAPAAWVRRTGLAAVNRLGPLRRGFMAVARGETGDLPPMLRGEPG
ncbi:MAG: FAD-dependent monooxygenase [Sphingomonadaceae bacterium]